MKFAEYASLENRYTMLTKTDPEAKRLLSQAQHDAAAAWTFYEQLAAMQTCAIEPSA